MSQPDTQLGKYAISAALGSGTFAETFRARDRVLDREIALKILHPVLMTDRGFVAQFQREARTLARLRHPNILTIYEVATINGRLCLALELAEGGSLADLLARRGRQDWAATLALLAPICAALDYMHSQGVLHRDLKPSNILLRGDGQPLIADFGLSRTEGQSMSAASAAPSVLGTLAYSAPELWDRRPSSPTTDIYALACVTYELLAGQRLFPAETLIQAAGAHARGPQFASGWRGNAPGGSEAVLRKALAAQPAQRYQSAGAFYNALRELAPTKRVVRPPTGAAPTPWRSWFAVGGTLLALFMALGVFASGGWRSWSTSPTGAIPTEPPAAAPTLAATPLPTWVPELVEVPSGPFLMGSSDADTLADPDERPQHTLELPTYWIGKTEVTNAQFRSFVEGDGYSNQAYWTEAGWAWRQGNTRTQPFYWDGPQWNGDTQPVVGVTWFEAVAYVRWLSAQTGREFHLPSEAEWEKAARGTDGRTWPWGNDWIEGRANTYEAGLNTTTPVGQYPEGASPYGALDMAGNVWEWCATEWQKPYPYSVEDEWAADYLEQDGEFRVLRGGSWSSEQKFARGADRYDSNARYLYSYNVGLRVASSSPPP